MRVLTGGAIAISAALIPQVPVAAQRGARPPIFPTKDQFAASAEAKEQVAAARTIAGTDRSSASPLRASSSSRRARA
jgi:hypothetical protein